MIVLYVLVVALSLGVQSAFPQNPCDPELIDVKANPYGYRLRGDRCEGIYVQQVSGAPLTIASWTESFENYDLASTAPLILQWDPPGPGMVRLRGWALRRRLYFRMDALKSAGSRSFSWKPDLLAALHIAQPELGVVGFISQTLGGAEHDLYLPLRIRQSQASQVSGSYRLLVLPGVELKEIFVTVVAAGGAPVVKNGTPLGYGYYPPERPVEIPIDGLPKAGIYRLELGATLRNGGTATSEFWFYHPGK